MPTILSGRRRTGTALVGAACVVGAMLSACSSSTTKSASAAGSSGASAAATTSAASGSTAATTTGGKKVVGVTLLSLQYPFLVTLDNAMKAEAAKKGIDLISLDPRQSVATEMSQVEDLITKKVNLIVMIPVDQQASEAAAKKVNAAGIPLIQLNTKLVDSFTSSGGKYVSYVGSDDTEAGVIQAQYLLKELPQGGKVIYLIGQPGGASTERRKAGFESTLKQNPNIKIVTEAEADGSRAKAKTVMENLLQRYGGSQISAVIAQNDEMALGALSAIDAANRHSDFKITMGIDGSQAGLDAVKSGELTATVFQDAVAQGTQAIDTAAAVLDGQTVENNIDIPFKLVTKDNVDSFLH